jgi:hypothetical protein
MPIKKRRSTAIAPVPMFICAEATPRTATDRIGAGDDGNGGGGGGDSTGGGELRRASCGLGGGARVVLRVIVPARLPAFFSAFRWSATDTKPSVLSPFDSAPLISRSVIEAAPEGVLSAVRATTGEKLGGGGGRAASIGGETTGAGDTPNAPGGEGGAQNGHVLQRHSLQCDSPNRPWHHFSHEAKLESVFSYGLHVRSCTSWPSVTGASRARQKPHGAQAQLLQWTARCSFLHQCVQVPSGLSAPSHPSTPSLETGSVPLARPTAVLSSLSRSSPVPAETPVSKPAAVVASAPVEGVSTHGAPRLAVQRTELASMALGQQLARVDASPRFLPRH